MRECPNCGAYVLSSDNICPRCDHRLDHREGNVPKPLFRPAERPVSDSTLRPSDDETAIAPGPAPLPASARDDAADDAIGLPADADSGPDSEDVPTTLVPQVAEPRASDDDEDDELGRDGADHADANRSGVENSDSDSDAGDEPSPMLATSLANPLLALDAEPIEVATVSMASEAESAPLDAPPSAATLDESAPEADAVEDDAAEPVLDQTEPDLTPPVERAASPDDPNDVPVEADSEAIRADDVPEPVAIAPPVAREPGAAESSEMATAQFSVGSAVEAADERGPDAGAASPAAEATPPRTDAPTPAHTVPPAPYTPPPPPVYAPPAAPYAPGYATGYGAPGYGYDQPTPFDYLQQRIHAYQRGGYKIVVHGQYEATLSFGKGLSVGTWILALVTLVGVVWYLLVLAMSGFRRDRAYVMLEGDGRVYEDGPGAAHVRLSRARGGRRWSIFGVVVLVVSVVLALVLGAVAAITMTQERYQAALREAYPAVTLFEEQFSDAAAVPDDVPLMRDGAVVFSILAGIAAVGIWGGATLFVIGTVHASAFRVRVPPLPGYA